MSMAAANRPFDLQPWSPESWRAKPVRQVPAYPDADRLGAMSKRSSAALPAAGFCRRGAQASRRRWPRSPTGEAFLLQGGDCAESFAELHRRQHPRHLPRAAADGGGADLRRRRAGGEGRPHRRPVRQAALGRHRDASTASTLPSYRGDIINGIEFTAEARMPDPQRMMQAYCQSAGDAQPAARLRAPAAMPTCTRCIAGCWASSRDSPAGRALPGPRRPHRRDAGLHGAPAASTRETMPQLRETDFYTSHEALLLPLRAGADPRRFHHRRLVRHARPTCCGSATAPASSTARMSNSARHQEPDRPESAARRWSPTSCCG